MPKKKKKMPCMEPSDYRLVHEKEIKSRLQTLQVSLSWWGLGNREYGCVLTEHIHT